MWVDKTDIFYIQSLTFEDARPFEVENFKFNILSRESADILGVANKLPNNAQDAKHVLEYVFAHIVEFKKLNQEVFDNGDHLM